MKSIRASLIIIDDDEVARIALHRAFTAQGWAGPVLFARDGVEALELLRGPLVSAPHLVLVDINMPRMNGLEFLSVLRSDAALADSVVFVVSTSTSPADMEAAYRLHAAGYIVKGGGADEARRAAGMLTQYAALVSLPGASRAA